MIVFGAGLYRSSSFAKLSLVLATIINFIGFPPSVVYGQLIGNRTVGAPAGSIQSRPPGGLIMPSALGGGSAIGSNLPQSAGVSQGATLGSQGRSGRFVRGNKGRGDFIGTNRAELSGFVGSGQALGVGRVPPATDSLRVEGAKGSRVNRSLPPQPTRGPYYPRIDLDLDDSEPDGEFVGEIPLDAELKDRIARVSGGQAKVALIGTTAYLRGTVDSRRTTELLVQLLNFEPGIDRVKNELQWKR